METETRSQLVISHGKFYRDGVEEKHEFGNTEQIRVLREYEKMMDEIDKGIIVEPEYEKVVTATVYFKCVVCGGNVYKEIEDVTEDDIDCFDEKTCKCRKCNQEYEFSIDNDDNLRVAKC